MTEWRGTRHCPSCNAAELGTAVVDDRGSLQTWCKNCRRIFRKYNSTGDMIWEDEEWKNSEEQ